MVHFSIHRNFCQNHDPGTIFTKYNNEPAGHLLHLVNILIRVDEGDEAIMSKKKSVRVVKRETGQTLLESARWCSSRLCRLRGLQFRRRLNQGEALILVKDKDSIANSSIHMFFVFFPIAAIWVDRKGKVTSAQLAKPWRPYYASPEPASYVIETSPEVLEQVSVGDVLDFQDAL